MGYGICTVAHFFSCPGYEVCPVAISFWAQAVVTGDERSEHAAGRTCIEAPEPRPDTTFVFPESEDYTHGKGLHCFKEEVRLWRRY